MLPRESVQSPRQESVQNPPRFTSPSILRLGSPIQNPPDESLLSPLQEPL